MKAKIILAAVAALLVAGGLALAQSGVISTTPVVVSGSFSNNGGPQALGGGEVERRDVHLHVRRDDHGQQHRDHREFAHPVFVENQGRHRHRAAVHHGSHGRHQFLWRLALPTKPAFSITSSWANSPHGANRREK